MAAILVGICAATSVMAWSLSGHFARVQAKGRVIEKAFTRNEVVEFTEIKVSQKDVEPGKGFEVDDEWLNKVFVKVRNISKKPIVFLEVGFDFPETKATGSEMSYRLAFGQKPGSRFPQNHDALLMLPGNSLGIPLDKDYTKLKSFVGRRHRIEDIHKLELSVVFVIFADRTGWAAGNFYRQDPDNPNRYLNVGDNPPHKEARTITKYSWRDEPLEISSLKVKGKAAKLGANFEEDDDWLDRLTVTVKNTSNKTTAYIQLDLEFPTPDHSAKEPESVDHLLYGTYPQPSGQEVTPHPDQPPLQPGAKAELVLTDYEGLRDFLIQTKKSTSIKQIQISISEVVFDDGTKWSGGQLFRRNPGNPNRWEPDRPQISASNGKPKYALKQTSFHHPLRIQDPGILPGSCHPLLY